ncbi:MAG: alpha/beta hydrolase [Planctomycetaceae bacterium]
MPRTASVLLLLLSSGCASLGSYSPLHQLEQALVYQPETLPDTGLEKLPARVEEVWIDGDTGVRLNGWFVEADRPRGVLLYCHGNGGSVRSWGPVAVELQRKHQLSVLVFDYRGFGRSTGTPSEEGIVADARAARRWLADRMGVSEQDIILMGRSLGGAVAIQLAAEDGCRGLVLQSTFKSLPSVARRSAWWLLPDLNMQNRFPSIDRIPRYQGRVLISHGDADRLIPDSHGRKLYEAAPGPKEYISIPGGDHNCESTEEFAHALDRLVEQT